MPITIQRGRGWRWYNTTIPLLVPIKTQGREERVDVVQYKNTNSQPIIIQAIEVNGCHQSIRSPL